MRLTHLADYAVVMMTAAARRPAAARLSATELSDETGVPLPTAQKLMQRLAGAGLLTGTRGAGGGYVLARGISDISLADIVEAVEGPIAMTQCSGSDEPSEAHHAWGEVWMDGLGWVGFDPANRTCPTDAYVRLATGLDSASAAPIRGTRLGGAYEALDVIVEVQQQNSQQQQ